jgi:hypothetical protein|nr:MAG TPA: tail completion protein [Caudoviricetes sp.]
MKRIAELIKRMGLPFAYDHFAEGESPAPPFICYLTPGSDNFAADGRAYYKINIVNIELYTDIKDPSVEQKVESVLDATGIFYDKTEVWIESEKLYEVLYQFELEVNNNGE